jgi:hypothetical protein
MLTVSTKALTYADSETDTAGVVRAQVAQASSKDDWSVIGPSWGIHSLGQGVDRDKL